MTKKEKKAKKIRSPQKKAEKFEQELPELARRLGIRVSSPYGYYPEDVDKIISNLEKDVSSLTKENKDLRDQVHNAEEKSQSLQTELTQIKMQVSLMEIPDASAEENFAMLSRISTITGKNEEVPPVNIIDEDDVEPSNIKTVTTPTPIKPLNITGKSTSSNNTKQPTTYSNVIKPKMK